MANVPDTLSAVPWAILPDRLREMAAQLPGRLASLTTGEAELREMFESAQAARTRRDAVTVIPLYGVIEQKPSLWGMLFGGTSTEMFAAEFRAALVDPSVKAILIDVNSPGGSVYGIEELAAEIAAARGRKKVVAIANSEAASAAYHIASQAQEFVASPSAMVGSIGVVYLHQDWSAAYEQAGVKTTVITSGKYKWEGSEYAPLTEEAKAYLQKVSDAYYAAFVTNVAKGRRVSASAVRNGFGQGRMVMSRDAKAEKMVDRVATFAQTYVRLGGQLSVAPPPEEPDVLDLFNQEEEVGEPNSGGETEVRDPAVLSRLWEISRESAQGVIA